MSYTTSVTQKGQVTIPADIRKFLGIKLREKVTFTRIDDQVTISAAKDFLSLKGSVKTSRTYSEADVDQKVLTYIKNQYDK